MSDDHAACNPGDEFLFIEAARAGTVDMRKSRSDDVVEHMLAMRDAGDHPSEISHSSKLDGGRLGGGDRGLFSRHPATSFRPGLARLEEEDGSPAFVPVSSHTAFVPVVNYDADVDFGDVESRSRVQRRLALEREEELDRAEERRKAEGDNGRSRVREIGLGGARPGHGEEAYDSSSRLRARPAEAASALGNGHDIASRFAAPKVPNTFAAAVERQMQEMANPQPPVPVPAPDARSHISNRSKGSRRSNRSRRHDTYENKYLGGRYDSPESRRPRSPASAVESSVSHPRRRDRDHTQRRMDMDRRNRHELILELDKVGVKFVGDEKTWELEHLLERHYANQHLIQRVATVKSCIKFGSFVVEKLMNLFLPKIPLRGWCEHLCAELDTGNHDQTLEQVSRRFWRKGPPNAFITLGLLIGGSMVMYCVGMRGNSSAGNAGSGSGGGTGSSGGGGGGGFGGIGGFLSGLLGKFGKSSSPPPAPRVNIASRQFNTNSTKLPGGDDPLSSEQPRRRSKMPPPT